MREPSLQDAIKKAYIPVDEIVVEQDATLDVSSPETTLNNDEEAQDAEATTPAAFPLIQPMKAAFYFDSVAGFGEWRILISTRADSNLREARRKDPKTFGIILKKMKYVIQIVVVSIAFWSLTRI